MAKLADASPSSQKPFFRPTFPTLIGAIAKHARALVAKKPAPAPSTPSIEPLFGHDKSAVEAFAFSGGGLDALMHLGVIHALIVRSRHRNDTNHLPHAFSGVSSGAVMAAVAAEVMGQTADTPEATCAARVSRFRQILNLFLEAPHELIASLLPDLYEVKSGRPLRSLNLATHNTSERLERNDAVDARSGFIRLINQVLGTSVPLSAVTRLTRIYLGCRAACEHARRWRREQQWNDPRLGRLLAAGREFVRGGVELPLIALRHGTSMAELVLWMYAVYLQGGYRVARERFFDATEPRPSDSATDAGGALSLAGIWTAKAWSSVLWLLGVGLWYVFWLGLVLAVVWHGTVLLTFAVAGLLGVIGLGAPAAISAGLGSILAEATSLAPVLHLVFAMPFAIGLALLLPTFPLYILDISVPESLLRQLSLDRDLLADYDVRRFLVRLFDPSYYLEAATHDTVIGRALRGEGSAGAKSRRANTKKKTLYEMTHAERLHVAPAALDITRGQLVILEDTWPTGKGELKASPVPVVDALMASTARTPFLRAQKVEEAARSPEDPRRDSYYIDAATIATEPLNALMDYLRSRVSKDAASLMVYAVTPYPVRAATRDEGPMHGAMRVGSRVRDLQRYQVSHLDRQLTDVYTRVIGSADVVTEIPVAGEELPRRYLSAQVVGIETQEPLRVHQKMLAAPDDVERRKAALRSIAAGCHAAVKVLHKSTLLDAFQSGVATTTCPQLLARLPLVTAGVTGLPEICQHCGRTFTNPAASAEPRPPVVALAAPPAPPLPEVDKPWTVLLLSGGVFRGVFQVGVVAGCLQAHLTPKLLVGSSVGSLMMTAAARLWSHSEEERPGRLRALAATFLALDQLVMTDRFADFVRRVTLRASYTDVSIKDLDRALRTYAESGPDSHNRTTRRVLAAAERLLYITPFELLRLVEASREDRWNQVGDQLVDAAQNFLNRSGVRDEILGSEPLQWLIDQLGMPKGKTYADQPAFDCYGPQMYRLVTATNLQSGSLEVFGMNAAMGQVTNASFSETLLASGAFPLVFRPRRESDVQPTMAQFTQYTDGGVMDNLPLYSAAKFIAHASNHGLTVRRPSHAPHLMVTGSLEPEFRRKDYSDFTSDRAEYWPAVGRRAKRIAYNGRAIGFAQAQDNFDLIYEHRLAQGYQNPRPPVRLRVSVVRAQWLCGTFGFHPMLGFQRERQAKSIAHGCASTLAYLFGEAENTAYAKAWGLSLDPSRDLRKGTITWAESRAANAHQKPLPQPTLRRAPKLNPPTRLESGEQKGQCWFRVDARCPFSKESAERGEDETQVRWLDFIYQTCGNSDTHES